MFFKKVNATVASVFFVIIFPLNSVALCSNLSHTCCVTIAFAPCLTPTLEHVLRLGMQVVGLYEEGDANNDGVMTREEHAALISQKSHSISGVMMELQTKFMLLMAEGRDQGEM